jgi:hypothetical protein
VSGSTARTHLLALVRGLAAASGLFGGGRAGLGGQGGDEFATDSHLNLAPVQLGVAVNFERKAQDTKRGGGGVE